MTTTLLFIMRVRQRTSYLCGACLPADLLGAGDGEDEEQLLVELGEVPLEASVLVFMVTGSEEHGLQVAPSAF